MNSPHSSPHTNLCTKPQPQKPPLPRPAPCFSWLEHSLDPAPQSGQTDRHPDRHPARRAAGFLCPELSTHTPIMQIPPQHSSHCLNKELSQAQTAAGDLGAFQLHLGLLSFLIKVIVFSIFIISESSSAGRERNRAEKKI